MNTTKALIICLLFIIFCLASFKIGQKTIRKQVLEKQIEIVNLSITLENETREHLKTQKELCRISNEYSQFIKDATKTLEFINKQLNQ